MAQIMSTKKSVQSTSLFKRFMAVFRPNRMMTSIKSEDNMTPHQSSTDLLSNPGPLHRILTVENLPQHVLDCEYAIRGLIVSKAQEIRDALAEDPTAYPFTKTIPGNIGNPQNLGQAPVTFYRQVLACLLDVKMLEHVPFDVRTRVEGFLDAGIHIGAYTDSEGHPLFRRLIADWLTARDGFPPTLNTIFLTNGASAGVKLIIEILLRDENDGIMVPVPQYPLYTANIKRHGGTAVFYYLEEEKGWSLNLETIKMAWTDALKTCVCIRAIVIINPGNPTGAVLDRNTLEAILTFCNEKEIVILADEVYQHNIYGSTPFISVRRVAHEMGFEKLRVVSYHSSSKGVFGECGLRGGLMQVQNIEADVLAQIYKLASISLCSNTIGQALMANIVTPPKPEEPSYPLYQSETSAIFDSLSRKAKYIHERLNQLEGVSCQKVEGAMYAFPSIKLSQAAKIASAQHGAAPDMFYCLELLKKSGVLTVPGSGFSQREGTWHFRITILPNEDDIPAVMDSVQKAHESFVAQYGLE